MGEGLTDQAAAVLHSPLDAEGPQGSIQEQTLWRRALKLLVELLFDESGPPIGTISGWADPGLRESAAQVRCCRPSNHLHSAQEGRAYNNLTSALFIDTLCRLGRYLATGHALAIPLGAG